MVLRRPEGLSGAFWEGWQCSADMFKVAHKALKELCEHILKYSDCQDTCASTPLVGSYA